MMLEDALRRARNEGLDVRPGEGGRHYLYRGDEIEGVVEPFPYSHSINFVYRIFRKAGESPAEKELPV